MSCISCSAAAAGDTLELMLAWIVQDMTFVPVPVDDTCCMLTSTLIKPLQEDAKLTYSLLHDVVGMSIFLDWKSGENRL